MHHSLEFRRDGMDAAASTTEGAILKSVQPDTPLSGSGAVSSATGWSRRAIGLVAAALLVAAPLSFFCLDYAVSHHLVASGRLPGDFAKLFEAAEHFGTIWGQLLILWAVFSLDRRRAFVIPRLAGAAIFAGIAADIIKLCISRARPKYFEFAGNRIGDSFTGWLPFGVGGADFQSFPSGHTASAVAFAVALGWAYPRARTTFFVIAGLVALQRIESTAHFISDTLVGAAIGWTVGCWMTGNTNMSRWWDDRERNWRPAALPSLTLNVSGESHGGLGVQTESAAMLETSLDSPHHWVAGGEEAAVVNQMD